MRTRCAAAAAPAAPSRRSGRASPWRVTPTSIAYRARSSTGGSGACGATATGVPPWRARSAYRPHAGSTASAPMCAARASPATMPAGWRGIASDCSRSCDETVPVTGLARPASHLALIPVALGVQIDLELGGVRWASAAAVKLGALLDGKRHVMDVAFHARGGLQSDGHGADGPRDLATHSHPLGGDNARHLAHFADDNLVANHIAFDFAVDLESALADDLEALADDLEVVADHRQFGGVRGAGPWL